MLVTEDVVRQSSEHVNVALLIDTKAAHRDAVDSLHASRIFIAPGDVVARASREHFDIGVARKMLGDIAGVQLGAAVDVGAVALHDDGELHCAEGSGPSSSRRNRNPASKSGSELVALEGSVRRRVSMWRRGGILGRRRFDRRSWRSHFGSPAPSAAAAATPPAAPARCARVGALFVGAETQAVPGSLVSSGCCGGAEID